MKLNEKQKFLLPDDDGNVILVTDVNLNFEAMQNKIIDMKGIEFEIDYENNSIIHKKEVNISCDFNINTIYSDNE